MKEVEALQPQVIGGRELVSDLPSAGREGESLAAVQMNHIHFLKIVTS